MYKENKISIIFSFDEKKFLPSSFSSFEHKLDNSLLPDNKNYQETMRVMFTDLVPNWLNIVILKSQEFESFRKDYRTNFGVNALQVDIDSGLMFEQMRLKLNDKINTERTKAHSIQRKKVSKGRSFLNKLVKSVL